MRMAINKREHLKIWNATKNGPEEGLSTSSTEKKDDDVKTFTAGEHSLFITEEIRPGQEIAVDKAGMAAMVAAGLFPPEAAGVDNLVLDLVGPQKVKKYELWIGDMMTSYDGNSSVNNLQRMLKELRSANPEDVCEVYIDSNGGSIDEGLRLMYAIQETFAKENIKTIISAKGYSMGSQLLTIGSTRVGIEDGAIMLHDYATGTGGSGQSIKDYVEHTEARFNALTKALYVEPGYMTQAEWDRYKDGKEFWLTTIQAAERGLLTEVILREGNTVTAEEYVIFINGSKEPKKVTKKKPAKKAPKKANSESSSTKKKNKKKES